MIDCAGLKQFTMTGSCENDSARNFNCSENSRFHLSSSCQEAGFEPSLQTAIPHAEYKFELFSPKPINGCQAYAKKKTCEEQREELNEKNVASIR